MVLIVGFCLTVVGFSLFVVSQNMWWDIPSAIPTMRPVEGIDYVLFTLTPILPIVGFGGVCILVIGAIIFFIDRKKNR